MRRFLCRTTRHYHDSMRLLESLASAFINTFGITQPSDQLRRRAAWYIAVLLLLSLVLCVMAGVVIFRAMQRQ